MTALKRNYPWTSGTDADVRTLVGTVEQHILDVGLTRVPVTNEFNLTTGVAVTSAAAQIGTRTYRFPDSDPIQATKPIFLQAEWRTDGYGKPYIRWWVAESIINPATGALGTPNTVGETYNVGNNYTSTPATYVSYVDGTFCFVGGVGVINDANAHNNHISSLIVDRSRTTSGVATADGYLVEISRTQYYPQSRSVYGNAPPTLTTSSYPFVPALIPNPKASTSAKAQDVNVFRHYMMVPGVMPSLGSLTYFRQELGADVPFTTNVLGAPHTYMPLGRGLSYWSGWAHLSDFASDHVGAIRWE